MWIITRLGVLFFICIFSLPAKATIKLPALISDNMVLQRDAAVKIWGWALPGEKVAVKFAGKNYSAKTGPDGKWLIQLKPVIAGGPYDMVIAGTNIISLKNILMGDVWFCSGQSNMVLSMKDVKESYLNDVALADYPEIRQFFVPTVSDISHEHADLPPGIWKQATPANVLQFSAAAYFFAKAIFLKYHVPLGLINSSVGGTPIQAWTSADGIKQIPAYAARLAQFQDTAALNKLMHPVMARNNTGAMPMRPTDKGLNEAFPWYSVDYQPTGWHSFWLPGYWADQGIRNLNGVVWFRKTVDVPVALSGQPLTLLLGRVVDADEVYINGVKIGNTTFQYPPRHYPVPAGLVKPGKNLIVVRVTNTIGKGGFVPDKRYELTNGSSSVDLRGDWQYKVSQVFAPLQGIVGGTAPFSAQNEPTGLYNTMVAPAINYTIRGFLWYQGEANTSKAPEYVQLMATLITDWRSKWQQGNFPFIYAQLPNFMETDYSPVESQWAELRDAQLKSLTVPNTGMAITIDLGEWNDIHPSDKKVVGERMALIAEKLAYGDNKLVASGPLYQSAKIAGDKIEISFSSTGSGLTAKGGDLNYFAVAGADKKFVWADAKIDGDKVIVSSAQVPNPQYVRYAWADNPDSANLYNKEGLPASPFATDK